MANIIVVDVESDGPCPGLYSMVCFGAVCLNDVNQTFYGETSPISDTYKEDALKISGFSRVEHEGFESPYSTMNKFNTWLSSFDSRPIFISDNPAFDWQWINYYFHCYVGHNPFGFSARRIGDLYAGMNRNFYKSNDWKKFRKTKHTHNPVDDAKGNVEALLEMRRLGLKI
jgi:hypothetical protein